MSDIKLAKREDVFLFLDYYLKDSEKTNRWLLFASLCKEYSDFIGENAGESNFRELVESYCFYKGYEFQLNRLYYPINEQAKKSILRWQFIILTETSHAN
jgi:hypothetical protein